MSEAIPPDSDKIFICTPEACRIVVWFTKYGDDGVYIQCRRNGGAWALLAVDMVTPYIDNQPLLVANTPETRALLPKRGRMSFWDAGDANGDWTAVTKVMVGA